MQCAKNGGVTTDLTVAGIQTPNHGWRCSRLFPDPPGSDDVKPKAVPRRQKRGVKAHSGCISTLEATALLLVLWGKLSAVVRGDALVRKTLVKLENGRIDHGYRTLCVWISALTVFLLWKKGGPHISSLWDLGFGTVTTGYLLTIASSAMGTALTANSPQLLISIVYASYNLLITSMMMTAEYNNFAVERKSLRVSEPAGQQRSSYYLQLPYRYAIPLIVASGALHWLVSQSIFEVRINIFNDSGVWQPDLDISACGWSPIALLFTICLGGLMIVILCLLGFRKYHMGMPILRSNSLNISAACHPPIEKEDAALFPISFGAVDVKGYQSWHACFTHEPVMPLIRKFDGTFRLDLISDTGDELDLILPPDLKSEQSYAQWTIRQNL